MGRTIIPIGPHSISNGISLSGAAARDPRLVKAFASAALQSFNRMDRLFLWQRDVVADRIAAMRVAAQYVPAPAYLAFAAEHGAPQAEMFRPLAVHFGMEDGA